MVDAKMMYYIPIYKQSAVEIKEVRRKRGEHSYNYYKLQANTHEYQIIKRSIRLEVKITYSYSSHRFKENLIPNYMLCKAFNMPKIVDLESLSIRSSEEILASNCVDCKNCECAGASP